MTDREILALLRELGLDSSIAPPRFAQAAFADVYDLGDCVLRAQKTDIDTFIRQQRLLHAAAALAELRMPAAENNPVQRGGKIWHLYRKIPGHTPCTWHDWEKAEERHLAQTFSSLRCLHERTRGKFPFEEYKFLPSPFSFAEKALAIAKTLLSRAAAQRLEICLQRFALWHESLKVQDFCFIHGDWHPGNILWDGDDISGCIDMDFCHIGHPFEDLGFTMMMLMRDCRNNAFTLRPELFEKYASSYGVTRAENLKTLQDMIIVFALFDILFFSESGAADYLQRQCLYAENLCAWIEKR